MFQQPSNPLTSFNLCNQKSSSYSNSILKTPPSSTTYLSNNPHDNYKPLKPCFDFEPTERKPFKVLINDPSQSIKNPKELGNHFGRIYQTREYKEVADKEDEYLDFNFSTYHLQKRILNNNLQMQFQQNMSRQQTQNQNQQSLEYELIAQMEGINLNVNELTERRGQHYFNSQFSVNESQLNSVLTQKQYQEDTQGQIMRQSSIPIMQSFRENEEEKSYIGSVEQQRYYKQMEKQLGPHDSKNLILLSKHFQEDEMDSLQNFSFQDLHKKRKNPYTPSQQPDLELDQGYQRSQINNKKKDTITLQTRHPLYPQITTFSRYDDSNIGLGHSELQNLDYISTKRDYDSDDNFVGRARSLCFQEVETQLNDLAQSDFMYYQLLLRNTELMERVKNPQNYDRFGHLKCDYTNNQHRVDPTERKHNLDQYLEQQQENIGLRGQQPVTDIGEDREVCMNLFGKHQ